MAGYCISDDAATRDASLNEIIRRYFNALCDHKRGLTGDAELTKIESLMNQAGITEEYRRCVRPALDRARDTGAPAVAIELPDGRLITGKTSSLLGASSAALLNAVKLLSNQPKEQLLIDPGVIEPIQSLKTNILGNNNPRLHTDEVLIALSMSAIQSEPAKKAFDALSLLRGCEAHSSVILSQVDADVYRKLGINLTCEPHYQVKKLYHKA